MTDQPSCLVDAIELYGARSEPGGDLSRAEAVHQLQQFSDGGLTHLGAERAIFNWRTRRAEYEQVFDRAQRLYDQLRGGAS